jgi:hypothetical protein
VLHARPTGRGAAHPRFPHPNPPQCERDRARTNRHPVVTRRVAHLREYVSLPTPCDAQLCPCAPEARSRPAVSHARPHSALASTSPCLHVPEAHPPPPPRTASALGAPRSASTPTPTPYISPSLPRPPTPPRSQTIDRRAKRRTAQTPPPAPHTPGAQTHCRARWPCTPRTRGRPRAGRGTACRGRRAQRGGPAGWISMGWGGTRGEREG